MSGAEDFVDYYSVLSVSPLCGAAEIDAAYRALAKKYHPDHVATADVTRFNEVTSAYRILRDSERRSVYDEIHADRFPHLHKQPQDGDPVIGDGMALRDGEAHDRILMHLYKKRRNRPSEPGEGSYALAELVDCSAEAIDFHTWYLREKGYLQVTENGTYAISVEGIDHVIATSRSEARAPLLLSREDRRDS